MKKFILGFIVGAVVMFFAGKVWWYFMPDFLGGRGGIFEPNPVVSCRDLVKNASDFGNLELIVTNHGKPETNLEVDLSTLKPEAHPDGPYSWPKRLCVKITDLQGKALFKNIPVGTVYVFFNNDVNNYIKRFSKASDLIMTVEIEKDKTLKKDLAI